MANTRLVFCFPPQMMLGLVVSLLPICRLPKVHQVLARKEKSQTNNYYEVKSSFQKKEENNAR